MTVEDKSSESEWSWDTWIQHFCW